MTTSTVSEMLAAGRSGPAEAALLAVVTEIARTIAHRYPAPVYAETPSWTADALADLVQDVYANELLSGGLAWARDNGGVESMDQLRRLLAGTVRRTLIERRRRTVVDNILDRLRDLAVARDLPAIRPGPRLARPQEIFEAVRLISRLPRIPPGGAERAPMIFSRATLGEVLSIMKTVTSGTFGLKDLADVLEQTLTPWLVGRLEEDSALATRPAAQLDPEETTLVAECVKRIVAALDNDGRTLLRAYFEGVPDEELAARIGRSRQTVIRSRTRLRYLIADEMKDLVEPLPDVVVRELGARLRSAT